MKRLFVSEELLKEKGMDYFKDETAEDYNNADVGDGDIVDGMLIMVDDMGNVDLFTTSMDWEEQSAGVEIVPFGDIELEIQEKLEEFKVIPNQRLMEEIEKLENKFLEFHKNLDSVKFLEFKDTNLTYNIIERLQFAIVKELNFNSIDNEVAFDFTLKKVEETLLEENTEDVINNYALDNELERYIYVLECEIDNAIEDNLEKAKLTKELEKISKNN